MNGKGTVRYCYAAATGILIVAGMALKAPLVHADTIDFKAFGDARRLSDKELAGMRGRFVAGNHIIAFGVSMSSQWFNKNNGEQLNTDINFQANMGSDPSVTFNSNLTAFTHDGYQQATQYAAGNGSTITNLGSGNGYGIVQTIQAGGDENIAFNDLQINIQSGELGGLSDSNVMSALTTDSGAVLTANTGENGMQTSITIPGHGAISQKIIPNRGLHQNVSLQSNFQQIRNITQLNIQIGEGMNPMSGQARRALVSLRGLRR